MPAVYLLHFTQRISERHTTQHYLGWTSGSLEARIAAHRAGRGARLCAVARERGIGFVLARSWDGADRRMERKLKRWRCSPRLCPYCTRNPIQPGLPTDRADLFGGES